MRRADQPTEAFDITSYQCGHGVSNALVLREHVPAALVQAGIEQTPMLFQLLRSEVAQ